MKTETIKAIIETRTNVVGLGKKAFNPHGRYNYVSIDSYYEKVANIAAVNGLSWVVSEKSFEMHPDVGKTGMIRVTYSVSLMHDSGDFIPDFTNLTIVHPIQGAQTVGSAMSYMDKVFMRQFFAVATGESQSDADETDPTSLMMGSDSAPKTKKVIEADPDLLLNAPAANPDTAKALEAIFIEFLPTARTEDELKQFWSDNNDARTTLKNDSPESFDRVLAAFSKRKAQLKKMEQN